MVPVLKVRHTARLLRVKLSESTRFLLSRLELHCLRKNSFNLSSDLSGMMRMHGFKF